MAKPAQVEQMCMELKNLESNLTKHKFVLYFGDLTKHMKSPIMALSAPKTYRTANSKINE